MRANPWLLLSALLLGCPTTGDDDTGDDDSVTDPCEDVSGTEGTDVALEVFASGFTYPVFVTHAGDGSGRIFVVEQAGVVQALDADGNKSTWLDIRERVADGGERGLLSLAFHPDFATNGRFFVYYTAQAVVQNGSTTVSEFTVADPPNGAADSGSERVLLTQGQPAPNHNGGQIAFGPDGYLYIGLGDGGGADDTYGNGQRPNTLLAKILRIDVDGEQPYGVPSDNPFVGDAEMREETYTWGMRNPWRFSFDRQTGALWIADVGQNAWEEVSIGEPGGNYGWPLMESDHCYDDPSCDPDDFVRPVYEYDHMKSNGVSITGGYVYRGCRYPDLRGLYFFSDYNYFDSPLWTLDASTGGTTAGSVQLERTGTIISSFGEDEAGELYVCDHGNGRVLRVTVD